MLNKTSYQQFVEMNQEFNRAVVSKEMIGDLFTPVTVFQSLASGQTNAILLDTSDYSEAKQAEAGVFIGLDPIATFRAIGKQITVTEGEASRNFSAEPFQALRDFYQRYRCQSSQPLAKFAGGMVGLMSHDAIRLFEDIPDCHPNEDEIPDLQFTCYGTHIIFDRRTAKVLVAQVVSCQSDNSQQAYELAMSNLDQLIQRMYHIHLEAIANKFKISSPDSSNGSAESLNNTGFQHDKEQVFIDSDDAAFGDMVKRAQYYITQGDAFQIVPSRRFRRHFNQDDFHIYRALKVQNPSPYMYYIRCGDYSVIGASPEKLISLQNGIVEINPIAGSRKRGDTPAEDEALAEELLNDGKELAEHMMLVDLARNDVGSVAIPGSVVVCDCKTIKKFSRIMHITSRVQGKLRSEYDVFDVLKAGFPAGTTTGAPKIRAMEIIDEIEQSRRGLYGGAVCAIDNQGQLDSCIIIRTAVVKNGIATIRAGGGVVLDSDPQKEAQETRQKAQSMLDAILFAEELSKSSAGGSV